MIKKCKTHDREYSYTCDACDFEVGYGLQGGDFGVKIDAFRAGCLGGRLHSTRPEVKEAYERGQWFKKHPYKR